jgi:septal ring factor EnvC (AmiA/AmiB activator)
MDPFSVTVGTIALVQFCIKSGTLLRDAIKSIKTANKEVTHIHTEIEYLIEVLQALERNVKEDENTLDSLKPVLEQCAEACDDLSKAISDATADTKQPTEGIRIWMRLKRRGTDIEAFRKLIDSYKATLTVAIADLNL